MVRQQLRNRDKPVQSNNQHFQARQWQWSRDQMLLQTPEHQGYQKGHLSMQSSLRVAHHLRAGRQDMQQLQGVTSNLTLRLGLGNQRGFRTGMKRKRTIDGEVIKEGEEAEVVVDEDLVEETEVTVGEEGIEGETEATEEGIEAGMIESMMIGERIEGMIESIMTEVTDRMEDTEVVGRMEVVVDTEAVVELRGVEEAQEVE